MAANDLTIFRNVGLDDAATSTDTSTIGEPSIAVSGHQAFMTGNWYASRSTNDGQAWTHVDPFTSLPSAAGGFCCDQVVVHDRRRECWIWVLQYVTANGTNVFRIAASRNPGFPNGSWYWWDIAPALLDGHWSNNWFDYPDVALTNDNAWITFNMFDASDNWQRAVVMKFPLATIAAAGTLVFNWWATTDVGSLRLTQGAGQTMYWASHLSDRRVRLFAWADASNGLNWWDIDVAQWSGTYSSIAPNGVNWLGRIDGRITGAAVGGGKITLMWTSGSRASWPNPFIRVARIDEATKRLVDQPDIWSASNAWAYPAASSNERGELGFTAFYGGAVHPGHIVGLRDDAAGAWRVAYSRAGGRSPTSAAWGDYLTCRSHEPYGHTWVAAGYTLQGGTDRRNVEPRFVHFGFEKDRP
jgi:hypothetical protein